jgi:hypothetical protein
MSDFVVTTGFELLIFLFTSVVGYITLIIAYDSARLLDDWKNIDAFDKAMRTFILGGFVTWLSVSILTRNDSFPVNLLEYANKNSTSVFILDLLIAFFLGLFLADYMKGTKR